MPKLVSLMQLPVGAPARLVNCGVFGVFRVQKRRSRKFRSGQRLGREGRFIA